ncbi:hypothetical protein, partial [Modestobacter sp. NPDC049651]|uniref:hypothetical protein n=1 Tax=Modestobacter sp. NPDC049651 TaxID=3155777 RepID=UPI0033C56007
MRSQSVEAPSREEAIAAAKEQFGPTAKVVGVRRLRSGGVMGFFSTERFVAEVEVPDAPAAPAATDRPRGSRVIAEESVEDRLAQLADLMAPAGGGAPLSLYGPGGAPRAAAADDAPARRPQSRGAGTSARPQPVRPQTGGAFAGDLPEGLPDGLAEVLASAQAASAARRAGTTRTAASGAAAARPAREPRPAAPAAAASKAAPAVDKGVAAKPFAPARHRPTLVHDLVEDPRPEAPTEVSAGPSPFTAALARMVGNDRQVTAAVAEAVEQSLAAEQAAVAEAEIPEVEVIPEPEPEVTPEPEVVAEVEVTAEPEVIAEPEVTPEPEVIPEPEVVAEVEVVPEPEVVAEVEVTAEPEVIPEPEVVAEVEVVPEPEVVAEVEVTAEP